VKRNKETGEWRRTKSKRREKRGQEAERRRKYDRREEKRNEAKRIG
jgi:hypothetical protein